MVQEGKGVHTIEYSSKSSELLQFKQLYEQLRLKYSDQDILSALNNDAFIPLSIFTKQLSVLETLAKYFIEVKGYSLKRTAENLARSSANVWNAYNASKKKHPKDLPLLPSPMIPLTIFRSSTATLLESLVAYLKESSQLTYHEIAQHLFRNDRTIWTTYQRYLKKHGKQ